MDVPDRKSFVRYFFALPFNIHCLLWSSPWSAFCLAALHFFSQPRCIYIGHRSSQIIGLQLQISDWRQKSIRPESILFFLMISLAWPGCTRGPFRGKLPPVRELRFDDPCARDQERLAMNWAMSLVWLSYADAGHWKTWEYCCESSSGLYPINWTQSLWASSFSAALAIPCVSMPHHSMHADRSERKRKSLEEAADVEVEVLKFSPHPCHNWFHMMQSRYILNRYSELPKNNNFGQTSRFIN